MRFPVLWERHEQTEGAAIDWTWTDKRLKQLSNHSISPIAGLVHHGSGPSFTNLGRESFARGLARYAGQVAKRYPWLEYYTPVNEPLTTARFSGLYGLWYPHHRSDFGFCTMLLNQMKGVVLAMQEIRKVNPDAKLIQTEDLGKTYSVPSLEYQASFENDRRFLSFDLLCGKVNKDHPLWDFFIRSGIREKSLEFFQDNPCPPDIMGLNYYVTSERFLDDRLDLYPRHMHKGNWLDKYVDIEAVRIDHGQPSGLRHLLQDVQERYDIPIAITEAHLNCTREEQLRWFKEIWDTCCSMNNEGSRIKGVTAWSLFGAFGWNKLVTTCDGEYEPGVFDLRGPVPRPTALAQLIRSLSTTKDFTHPVLAQKGWWHRQDRFAHKHRRVELQENDANKPVLIIGNDGPLLKTFEAICKCRALSCRLLLPTDYGLSFEESVKEAIKKYGSWALIDATNEPQSTKDRTFLAALCSRQKIKFMALSNDEAKRSPEETDASALIIKAGKLFSAYDSDNVICHEAKLNEDEALLHTQGAAFTYIPDLVNVSLDLLIDEEKGTWNLAKEKNYLMPSLKSAFERYFAELAKRSVNNMQEQHRFVKTS
jgi:dTDP-4-dehydrorhamnose reductase